MPRPLTIPIVALGLLATLPYGSCLAHPPAPEPTVPGSEAELVDPVHRLVGALNAVEQFPVRLEVLEQASGLPLASLVKDTFLLTQMGDVSLQLSGDFASGESRGKAKDLLVDTVRIEARGEDLALPEAPPGATRFDLTTYAYLPIVEQVERVGSRYRALQSVEQREGTAPGEITRWTYRVDDHRGPFVTEAEVTARKEVVLDLLQAIREDRFEPAYQAFVAAYPEDALGSHAVHGTSITIRYFDDRVEGRGDPFLKEDGLTAYVGIHVYNEQYGEDRYGQPWLFDFFGIERLDARRFWRGAPYNPVDNGIPGHPHPQADLTNPLPDLSAAGYRAGGLVYYSHLEWRDDGWTFECPGFYPHDGTSVPIDLDPALIQFGGFTVTHSRPR